MPITAPLFAGELYQGLICTPHSNQSAFKVIFGLNEGNVNQLKTHLRNAKEIKNILREVETKFELDDGSSVQTLLVYLPCNNGVSDHSELLKVIKDSIMSNFVLSCSEIERKLAIKSKVTPEMLFKKAVRKFSQHTAQGELGELILFTLLEVFFSAPKILSKISLKTSRRMPVYGADAVHAQYVDGSLRLYLGEAKLHQSFSSAATSAISSITNVLQKYDDEFDLIDTHIDFPEMDSRSRTSLLELLDPFSESKENITEILHTPCFIGFVAPSIFCDDKDEYIENYIELAGEHIEEFYVKLKDNRGNVSKTALLLLPFSCIEDLVSEFISYMGIKR